MVGPHPIAMAPIAMVTLTEREVGDGRVGRWRDTELGS